jgi:hypothetical protein
MINYVIALIAVVALCGAWAVFQIWLSRHDPEANQCLRRCGDCNCDREENPAS